MPKPSSRNSSRKSTKSHVSVSVDRNDEDFPSILLRKSAPTAKKTTPTSKESSSPRPEFMEPLTREPSPTPMWAQMGLSEEEYSSRVAKYQKQMQDDMLRMYQEAIVAELQTPEYWQRRMERLEEERFSFHKKRGWSITDQYRIEQIDAELMECEEEIERIYAEVDRLEYEYD